MGCLQHSVDLISNSSFTLAAGLDTCFFETRIEAVLVCLHALHCGYWLIERHWITKGLQYPLRHFRTQISGLHSYAASVLMLE